MEAGTSPRPRRFCRLVEGELGFRGLRGTGIVGGAARCECVCLGLDGWLGCQS